MRKTFKNPLNNFEAGLTAIESFRRCRYPLSGKQFIEAAGGWLEKISR
jgi:hypothetical protein